MLQRMSNREAGGGDNFEDHVKADLTEKIMLEQMLERGALLISGGNVLRQWEGQAKRL